ncbi:ribbon-helix-helix domain-containing protein [Thalassolituus sp. LLYu03]|uniref:ribbon-helix-helix domain-containing protein n=1 Tax=Thalassolituus sp. LLYu03 TaxID=3421656 RepID=UPI003D27DF1A
MSSGFFIAVMIVVMHYCIISASTFTEEQAMATRASLSLTEPNERWIQAQIDSKEFTSRSEVVNDLIRKAREVEDIRARLFAAEMSVAEKGWVKPSQEEMLNRFRERTGGDGKL